MALKIKSGAYKKGSALPSRVENVQSKEEEQDYDENFVVDNIATETKPYIIDKRNKRAFTIQEALCEILNKLENLESA